MLKKNIPYTYPVRVHQSSSTQDRPTHVNKQETNVKQVRVAGQGTYSGDTRVRTRDGPQQPDFGTRVIGSVCPRVHALTHIIILSYYDGGPE